jgi:hypothetical protein
LLFVLDLQDLALVDNPEREALEKGSDVLAGPGLQHGAQRDQPFFQILFFEHINLRKHVLVHGLLHVNQLAQFAGTDQAAGLPRVRPLARFNQNAVVAFEDALLDDTEWKVVCFKGRALPEGDLGGAVG